MKCHSITGALIGAILAVMGSASPISHKISSVAAGTASFSFDCSSVAGTFTAVAESSPTSTAALASTLDIFPGSLRNIDLGPVLFRHGHPKSMLSLPIVGTRTRTSVAASSTASHKLVDFHPYFGHGPIVPGQGFHSKSNDTVNHTPPMTTAPETHNSDSCNSIFPACVCDAWRRASRAIYLSKDPIGNFHVLIHNETTHKPLQGRSLSSATPSRLSANGTTIETAIATPSPTIRPVYRGHHKPVASGLFPHDNYDVHVELHDIEGKIRMKEQKADHFIRQLRDVHPKGLRPDQLPDFDHNTSGISYAYDSFHAADPELTLYSEQLNIAEHEKEQLEEARQDILQPYRPEARH